MSKPGSPDAETVPKTVGKQSRDAALTLERTAQDCRVQRAVP